VITEDELRDRLKAESVSLMPRGDLLKTLAEGHARRHKRARAGLIGGSIAATALVVALLGGLFTGGTPLPIDPAAKSDAEVIKRAQEAVAGTNNMIMNILTTERTSGGAQTHDGWALPSENRARIHTANVADRTFNPPDLLEEVNYLTQTVTTSRAAYADVGALITGSGVGDPSSWLRNQPRMVNRTESEIHVSAQKFGTMVLDVWLDPKTYLPKRAKLGSFEMSLQWLPATSENLRLLEHTVPPEFTRKEGQPSGLPTPSK
jgi:hypothetical protein